jgi:glycosyltransferase involved in cell wall biosynthesis
MNIPNNQITIALPNFNNAHTINETLDSITRQTSDAFNIVISDNYSQDGSKELISEWLKKRSNSRLVGPEEHCSYINHIMFLLQHIETPYLVFLAGDDLLSPNHIKLSNKILTSTASTNAVFYRNINIYENKESDTRRRFPNRYSKYTRLRSLNAPLGNISGNVYSTAFLRGIFADFSTIEHCGNCIDHYLCVKATEGCFITSNYQALKYRVHEGNWGPKKRQLMSRHHVQFLWYYLKSDLTLLERLVLLRRLAISYIWSKLP